MDLVTVKSSNLQAIGYDEQTKTLRILFQEGATYDYHNVPASVHGALMESESKGSFFQEHVVGGKFAYTKVNLREEGKTTMGKNKTQVAAEARASKKTDVQPQPAAAEVKATLSRVEQAGIDGSNPYRPGAQTPAPATPAPAVASKQMATIELLKAGWTERKVDLSKLTITADGKFQVIIVDAGWPRITIGPTGGVVVTDLKSYAKAFDAAMDGKALYEKQQAREAKKVTVTAPPAPAAEVKAKAAA